MTVEQIEKLMKNYRSNKDQLRALKNLRVHPEIVVQSIVGSGFGHDTRVEPSSRMFASIAEIIPYLVDIEIRRLEKDIETFEKLEFKE